jgi:hypothetical protein
MVDAREQMLVALMVVALAVSLAFLTVVVMARSWVAWMVAQSVAQLVVEKE